MGYGLRVPALTAAFVNGATATPSTTTPLAARAVTLACPPCPRHWQPPNVAEAFQARNCWQPWAPPLRSLPGWLEPSFAPT